MYKIIYQIILCKRGKIIGLYTAGHTKQEIAHIIGCSKKTVALWIRKHEEQGVNSLQDHRKNNKCPQKTTPEQNEEMVQTMDQNPFAGAATVIRNMNLDISVRTVRRRLNAANVHVHTSARKILLKPEHRMQRMQDSI